MGSVRVWSVLHLLPLLLKLAAASQAEDELVAIFSGDDGPELHEALAQDVNSTSQQKEQVSLVKPELDAINQKTPARPEPVTPAKQDEEAQPKLGRKVQAFIAKNVFDPEKVFGNRLKAMEEDGKAKEEPVTATKQNEELVTPSKQNEVLVNKAHTTEELNTAKKAIGACGSVNENTPIGKICQLLEELRLQLEEDAAADGEQFTKFSTWHAEQNTTLRTTIKNTAETVEGLQVQLEQQEALRKDKNLNIDRVANRLQSKEKELSEAVAKRAQAHKAFEDDEAKLLQMIDQLKHSLEVLGKQPPGDEASSKSSAAGLIEVAKKLKATLQGPDFSLGLSQRETIEGFLHVVQRRARGAGGGLRGGEAPVPDFLQVGDATSGPYGEYENQNSAVATALQSVLDKAQVNLQEQRMQEEHEGFVFSKFESDLKRQIRNTERDLTRKKGEVSESQEHSGSLQADLLNALELLKVSKEGLMKLEAEFASKNSSYQERSRKRADELIAVEAAGKIITSDDMEKAVPDHWSRVGAPTSFVQLHEVSRRKAVRIVREADTPALAFLALKTQTSSSRSKNSADPFSKVIPNIIREMIERLEQAAASDATKASWCQSESEKSSKSEDSLQASVEKLEARISEIDTEVAQLTADMKRIKEELAEMAEASRQATELREEEKQEALSAVIRYKDAQRLLRSALAVLQKIYGKEASPSSAGTDPDSGYKVSGMGAGVVGLLEIAIEDFAEMEEETQAAEITAQRDYKELMDETEVRTAVFNKDLDYKSKEKVKLESDRVQAVADLKNYQKESEALAAYIKQLKVQCNAADPYEVRKARRESELRSLQEALNYLEGTVP